MRRTNKFGLLIAGILLLHLHACSTFAATATVIPSTAQLTSTHQILTPAATEIFRQEIPATATDIELPHNLESERSEYCKPPYALLPVDDNSDISEEEIVYKLVDIWLKRYSNPDAHPYCRIDGYKIDKVYYDLDLISQPLEPRGDFMRVVIFSVKPIQIPNDWMSFSGELDQSNWLHLSQVVAAFKTDDGYTMKFAYP